MAAGGAAAGGPNMAAITSQMGFNASGYAGIHEIVFGRLKPDIGVKLNQFHNWVSGLIPHKNSFLNRKMFYLNSRAKGMSIKDLAPDAKMKDFFQQGKRGTLS